LSRAVVIAAAPNGARLQKSDHPAVPITRHEIVRSCADCVAAGATLLHVHLRDADGKHLLDAAGARDLEAEIVKELGSDVVVQTTTEAFGIYAAGQQLEFLKAARPSAASLAWREITRPGVTRSELAQVLAWCVRERIAVQYILYDTADLQSFRTAVEEGIVPEAHPHVLFVVGRYQSDVPSDARALPGMLSSGLATSSWMACAFGVAGYEVLYAAALLHGHVRIGFENGTTLPDGQVAPDNAALVTVLRKTVEAMGLRIANASECRTLFAPV